MTKHYYWEMLADELHQAGWSYGYCRAIREDGLFVYIVDAHRDDGHRYVVQAEDLEAAFGELKKVLQDALPVTST